MAAITRREYSGNAGATTLASSISNSDTSIAVDDGSGFPTGSNPFFIVIGRGTSTEEKVLCSGRSGNTITASSRGADDTSATSHDAGEAVEHVWTAQDADDVNKVAAALTTKGDLLIFGTEPTRLPVGADGTVPIADSADAEGVAYGDHGSIGGLSDDDHPQYALVAGDTFTGATTFQALGTFEDGIEGSLGTDVISHASGQSSWPTGLSWQIATSSSGSWPGTSGFVYMFNLGNTAATWQMFVDVSGASGAPVMSIRRWSTSGSWGSWREIAAAADAGAWEVDGSTEVALSGSIGTSYTTAASVSLTIPSDWGSWKCDAHAYSIPNGAETWDARIVIDGTAQQAQESFATDYLGWIATGGRRTGMTTTGSRTISLQAKVASGTNELRDIYLYARAVRTG